MPEANIHAESELLLKLYEARREKDLRLARRWFEEVFKPGTADEIAERYPSGSEGGRYIRMVMSYWQMVATIWKSGAISSDLLFPTTTEFVAVWEAVSPIIKAAREADNKKRPVVNELEEMCAAYTEWVKAD